MAPDKPPAGNVGAQGTTPVPGPAREHGSRSQISDFCASVNREARDANNELSPALEGRVSGKGRLRFHSAPNTGCRVRNSFIVPGDVVIARRRHGEWLLIDYVSRDGVMHSAWVDAARIALKESAARP
ncbi:hypothetical protein [Noviherbaspirillum aerium]|uniref:hypothetical protein n=1 Tax=Noviherbaspirillum aerium TaxID=2588497 RepID=UPI00124D9363|nr:hypothetical protein [Noviherbaspirillum aerium]